jgi:D-sedoheptulose 7-phosphate isomerase
MQSMKHVTGELPLNIAQTRLAETIATTSAIDPAEIAHIISVIEQYVGTDKTIFIAGNGGSATTASHYVCDLTKVILGQKPYKKEQRMRIISLADSSSLVTAIANDLSYDQVFSDQLDNLARPGDLLIVLSYSGNSENIVQAVLAAKRLNVATIGFLGKDGGKVRDLVDEKIIIASEDCGMVEDAHVMIGHLITHYFKVKNGYAPQPEHSEK